MKLTKSTLKQIIKEELQAVLKEGFGLSGDTPILALNGPAVFFEPQKQVRKKPGSGYGAFGPAKNRSWVTLRDGTTLKGADVGFSWQVPHGTSTADDIKNWPDNAVVSIRYKGKRYNYDKQNPQGQLVQRRLPI